MDGDRHGSHLLSGFRVTRLERNGTGVPGGAVAISGAHPGRRAVRVDSVTVDPLVLMTEVERATQRLLGSVAALDDAGVAAPSRLPGWTRGHVLTHVARHADGYANLLTWARTGVRTPQYASVEARGADIDAGAARPAAAHLDDIRASAARFAEAAAAMPAEAWTVTVQPTTGPARPAAALPWGRLREVEVHHVDLDTGYAPDDWPEAFSHHLLREVVNGVGRRPGAPALVLRPTELAHPLAIGEPEGAVTVAGPTAALAAWLAGRSDGAGLDVSPDGALPTPPSWL